MNYTKDLCINIHIQLSSLCFVLSSMAGTLPGVEYARRRRFHQTSRWLESPTTAAFGSTRQSSFCLHSSHHESHLSSISNSLQKGTQRKAYEDEKLGGVARAAKVRLDERLRAQWNSENKRNNSQEKLRCMEGRRTMMATKDLQKEVFGLKKTLVGSRRFMSWAKLGWKGSEEQEECAICLENFKNGQTLVHLPCTHRFHSRCLVPWLHTNAHCPCCRKEILN